MINSYRLRHTLAAATLVAGAVISGVGAAAPASASGASCPSSATWPLVSYPFYDSSNRLAAIGYIQQYDNGGCAYLVAQGPYSGMRKWMDIQIKDVPYSGQTGYDGGHYYYYAGPVSIYPGNGNCLEVWFDMQNSAGNWVVKTTDWTNCN